MMGCIKSIFNGRRSALPTMVTSGAGSTGVSVDRNLESPVAFLKLRAFLSSKILWLVSRRKKNDKTIKIPD